MEWFDRGKMVILRLTDLGIALLALGIIRGASACGLYCAVMIPAMVLAMFFRLDLYTTGHARHQAHAA